MKRNRATRTRVQVFTTRWVSRFILLIGVMGCLFAGVVLLVTPALGGSSSSVAEHEWDEDVASSWGRYNEGVAEEEPSWTGDDFLAVVEGAAGGQIVSMPGSVSYLDTSAVESAIAGTDLLVVVTPPSPLGASETTRVRDNTVQKYWANERDLQVVIVHGTEAYLPRGDKYDLIIRATPGPGEPGVKSLVYGDATDSVLRAIAGVLEKEYGEDEDVPTSAEELAPSGRAPTAEELSPVVSDLKSTGLYVDPDVPNPPDSGAAWPSLGKDAKVAIFPTASPGEYVDYATALREKFPDNPVLVVTGNWVQTAGLDAQRATDVMVHVRAVAGFPLAGAVPDPQRLVRMFSNIYEVATIAAESHTDVPREQPDGIPRWVAYLILGASLALVAGFVLGSWLESRAKKREPWEAWRDRVTGALLERYVAIGSALGVSLVPSDDISVARRRLDLAYAAVLEARGADERGDAAGLVADAWDHLEEAATRLDEPDIAPLAVLPASDREAPAALRGKLTKPGTTAKRSARKKKRGRSGGRSIAVGAGWFAGFFVALIVVRAFVTSTTAPDAAAVEESLQHSSVHVDDGADVDLQGVQQAISTRSLILVYADSADWNLADAIAAAYPDAVVFVMHDGSVSGAEIGSDAQVGDYDVYSLINDYYDVQSAAGTDPVAQAHQLALLYDRLSAEGSIDGIDRPYYNQPIPWVIIAIGMVCALAIAGFLVYAAGNRVVRVRTEASDVAGRRDALQLRLAESATQLLNAESAPTGVLARLGARERALSAEVQSAAVHDLGELRGRIDAFDVDVNNALATE